MSENGQPPKASGYAGTRDALDASWQAERTKGGLDLTDCLCCDCNKFGPWGDGQFRYCEDHVPRDLMYAAQAFKEKLARNGNE